MADEQTAQAVTAPDPADFPAWEAAEKAGTNPSEPQNSPAETAEQPKESTSVPADGEQPAAKAEVAPEPEAGKKAEQQAEQKADEEHGPGWYRRNIKRVQREAREENAALREEIKQLAARIRVAEPAAAQPATATTLPPQEPKEDEFETYGEYTRALTKFHARQIAAEEVAAFQNRVETQLDMEARQAQQRTQVEWQQQQDKVWFERYEAGLTKHDDFEEAVSVLNELKGTEEIELFVKNSEVGEEVVYILGKNPQEARRITSLPPRLQVKELTRIELRFSANGPANGKAKSAPESRTVTPPLKTAPLSPVGESYVSAAGDDPNAPEVLGDFQRWEIAETRRQKQMNRR